MDTVTFYSYKGGSGRTLLLANAARHLALSGKRVVAIDLDLEAPGLHHKLHIGTHDERAADVVPRAGLVDYLHDARTAGTPPPPADYLMPVPIPPGTHGSLHLMPAGASPSATYWRTLTALMRDGLVNGDREEEAVATFLELKSRIAKDLSADALLIDARTGITEFGGIAATILADTVVCLLLDNAESLNGTRAVLRSFHRAPRLDGDAAISIVPVLSRVTNPADQDSRRILSFLNQASDGEVSLNLERLFFLRDDRQLAKEEMLYIGAEFDPREPIEQGSIRGLRRHPLPNMHAGLGRDYRDLLDVVFPRSGSAGQAAHKRQDAVYKMRAWLTRDEHERSHHRPTLPGAFRAQQVDEGVELSRLNAPYADLVAYGYDGAPLLVALYADDLKPPTFTNWPQTRCVFLFDLDDKGGLRRRAYTRGRHGNLSEVTTDSAEWMLRLPATYTALDDPGDQSVDALLRSVQAGDDAFVGLLIRDWQHASFITLHGGMPYRPRLARQILDGLAEVDDIDTATRILAWTAPDPFERVEQGLHEGLSLEYLTDRNLHAPLFWRLPVAAKMQFGRRGRDHSPSSGLTMLARDLIGLRFDQDEDLRDDAALLVGAIDEDGPSQRGTDSDAEPELKSLWSYFSDRELTFEYSDAPPPELMRRLMLRSLDTYGPRMITWEQAERDAEAACANPRQLTSLLQAKDGGLSLPITHLLGAYDPTSATVSLYRPVLGPVALALNVSLKALENVVFLHETVHAICHLGRDLDGRHWSEFALPSPGDLVRRSAGGPEMFAHYFTDRMIERLRDSDMRSAFDKLTQHQPQHQKDRQLLRSLPVEDVRQRLMRMRGGIPSNQ